MASATALLIAPLPEDRDVVGPNAAQANVTWTHDKERGAGIGLASHELFIITLDLRFFTISMAAFNHSYYHISSSLSINHLLINFVCAIASNSISDGLICFPTTSCSFQ
jgi:hypothetical protein